MKYLVKSLTIWMKITLINLFLVCSVTAQNPYLIKPQPSTYSYRFRDYQNRYQGRWVSRPGDRFIRVYDNQNRYVGRINNNYDLFKAYNSRFGNRKGLK